MMRRNVIFAIGLSSRFRNSENIASTMSFSGILTGFGLGFIYFLASIPAGVAAGSSIWLAAIAAWLGYSAGAVVVLLLGAPLRHWVIERLKMPIQRDPKKLVWRVWDRWGLLGLALLAPVTIGPQAGGLLALAIGERPLRILVGLSLGVIPWCLLFAILTSLGIKIVH